MNEVVRRQITSLNQRVFHIDDANIRVVVFQRRQIRIVLPQLAGGSTYVCHELAGMIQVQITNSSSQHQDVPRTQERFQYELLH